MAEYPALPLFTDAFIADTTHLSAAQTGAYLMLLIVAWRTKECRLPDDDKMLARYARMDLRTWKVNRETVMSFWKKDDENFWVQGRLVDERKYVDDVRSKNSVAGKASALKKKKRHSTTVTTKVQPNVNPHTHTPLDSTDVLSPPTPQMPDWMPSEAWELFCKHRGKKFSDEAKRLAVKKLDELRREGNDPAAVLEQSVMNGWSGIFKLKENQNGTAITNHKTPGGGSIHQPSADADRRRRQGLADAVARLEARGSSAMASSLESGGGKTIGVEGSVDGRD